MYIFDEKPLFCVIQLPCIGLQAMCAVHLRLIGERVMDLSLVVTKYCILFVFICLEAKRPKGHLHCSVVIANMYRVVFTGNA